MTPNNSGSGRMRPDDPTPYEPPMDLDCESESAWVAWARATLTLRDNELADLRGRLGLANQRVEDVERQRKLYEEALEGMRKAERLRKSLHVYEPGEKVLIGPEGDIEATVTYATLDRGGLSYGVQFWSNGTLQRLFLHATEVHDSDTLLTHPAALGEVIRGR